jgi:hypothetical protein
MKKNLIILFVLLNSLCAFSQEKKVYEWDSKPTMHKIPQAYQKESAVVILDEINIEYRTELKDVYVYRSLHRIVKVLDDKGIEAFNKTTIPMSNGKTIEFIKARTILPNGKIIEIGKDKVKEIKNEQGAPEYLFAMEGVEKGAEVELQYTEKKPLSLFGTETFQFGLPVLQANFSLSSPKRMVFATKGYNGFPGTHDTLIDDTHYYSASMSNITPIYEEAYGDEEAMQMRIEYKLDSLPAENPDKRLLTWKDLARQLYTEYYDFKEKETRAAEKYIASIGVNPDDDDTSKIRKIEEAIKTNIIYDRDLTGDDVNDIGTILKSKTANEEGLIHLFAACFTAAEVKHELGITTNRFEHPFDEDFENWNFMDSYVFYFPKQKRFLSPASIYLRYPVLPSSMLTNKGLFCKIVTNEDGTNVKADIREIPPMPIKESENNINSIVSFTGDDLDPQIQTTHTFSGYTAMGVREAIVLLNKEKQKDVIIGIVNLSDRPEDVTDYKASNAAFHYYYDNKPLQFDATIKASQLMGKAGKKYLFKLGEVIGRQQELYQTVKRQLPISIPFPHSENRKLTINIPAGYKIVNPESIKMHVDDKEANGGTPTMGFYSDYKIEGNVLTVTINEWYSQLHFPLSYYETFRKVINASADFNKVVLVMVKG